MSISICQLFGTATLCTSREADFSTRRGQMYFSFARFAITPAGGYGARVFPNSHFCGGGNGQLIAIDEATFTANTQGLPDHVANYYDSLIL